MTDTMTPEQRHRCMSRIRSKDTRPEMTVRRWLWSRGYRYRKHVKRLPGTPDIVMRRFGIVIFIHGCFWHGHDCSDHRPRTNVAFWQAKIERNRARDEQQKERLRQMGWNVLTVWECQLTPTRRLQTLAEIEFFINHSFLLSQGAAPQAPITAATASESYAALPETLPEAAEAEIQYDTATKKPRPMKDTALEKHGSGTEN